MQEVHHYQFVKQIVENIFPPEIHLRFGTAIQDLPLRGQFNLSLDINKRLVLRWYKMSIYQLRNLLELLYKKTETTESHRTPGPIYPMDTLRKMVRDQLHSMLIVEIPDIMNKDKLIALKTDFLIQLEKFPAAGNLFLLDDV